MEIEWIRQIAACTILTMAGFVQGRLRGWAIGALWGVIVVPVGYLRETEPVAVWLAATLATMKVNSPC